MVSTGSNRMNFWKGRRVFVTGCTGFLGYWLTESLVNNGANVVGLVRDVVSNAPFFSHGLNQKVTTVRGSIEDYDLIERILNEHQIDTVFHLAAQAIVGVANRNPISTFETNIKGTWVLMEACRRNPQVSRIIVASSDKAYGQHDNLPYQEDFPLNGSHPYDVSKSCADLISTSYHHTYGAPVCITRCGNLFGPGDLNENRIIPGTMLSVLNNECPIIRSDGTMVRDYVYIQDIVNGYMLLAEKMDDSSVHGLAFNFGTGEPTSVVNLVRRILAVTGREDLQPKILNNAKDEIQNQYLSSERANLVLNWRPEASLETRLRETYAWYLKERS